MNQLVFLKSAFIVLSSHFTFKYNKMSNRQLDEIEEENFARRLARVLGLTYDDLSLLEYDLSPNESRGGFISGYVIIFSDYSPKKILKKIKGIDDNNTVYLSPNELD